MARTATDRDTVQTGPGAKRRAGKEPHMASVTQREAQQIEQANASGRAPVVFIHGLWLLPSSWDRWAQLFEENGYAALTPSWPDDPETVADARADPDVLARKTLAQVADHTADVIGRLDRKPAVMGHSTGGLLAQIIAGRGLSAATVAIDPGPSAAYCRSRSPRFGRRGRCSGIPSTGAAQSRSRWTSSSTGGRTRSAMRRRSSSTTTTTWLRPAWR
jgi:pimeloyl-ACP methyl ester carboxylesterase